MLDDLQARKKPRLEIPLPHFSSADTDSAGDSMDKCSVSVDARKVLFIRIDSFSNLLNHVDRIEVNTFHSVFLSFSLSLCLS
jgi:hypothetical protein